MKSRKFVREGQEWELPDAFYRLSIKLIIKNEDDRLLVLKDKTNDMWELPGGGVDHGEGFDETAKREVSEELGVELIEFGDVPLKILIGLHPDNYYACKLYFNAKFSSFDFTYEDKFVSDFVDAEEFAKLQMNGDESPIQQHLDVLWP